MLAKWCRNGPQSNITAYLHLHPQHYAVKLDIVNAFNSISRKTIFESTVQLAPVLLPYLYTFYSSVTPLLSHDRNHTLTMEEGVQQGDPLGTIFFCLGFHGVLNPIFQKVDAPLNALLLLLFVDDIFVCGSPVAIAEITTQIQSVLPNANLKLGTERGKMVCFSPKAPRSNDLKNLGIGKAEVITVLGSPIGLNTQISKWLHTLAQEYQQASQDHCLIMFSNPHESLELFVKTITPKLTYICRTTPLSLTPFQDFIKQTTTTNINYLLNLLQVPHLHPNKELHLSQVEAAGLPKSKGGGGLSYSQNTHQAAFLGSWISVY